MTIKKIRKILNEIYDYRTFCLSHKSTKKSLDTIDDLSHFLYGYYHLGLRQNSLFQFLSKNDDWRFYDESFLLRLQNANLCSGYYDHDWKITSLENNDGILVKKNNITLLSQKKHLSSQDNLQIDDVVSVKFPKDRIIISSGFYFIIGNNGNPDFSKLITRFYFNTNVRTIEEFIKILTKKLSSKDIPFQFKTLLNPTHYNRRDSSVLYVNKMDYEKSFSIISNIHKQHAHFFLPGIPFFAKKLFPGIGIAEEPQGNLKESFGQHRLNLIAGSLLKASKRKLNLSQLLKLVIRELEKNNLNINRLYLNSSSSRDIY